MFLACVMFIIHGIVTSGCLLPDCLRVLQVCYTAWRQWWDPALSMVRGGHGQARARGAYQPFRRKFCKRYYDKKNERQHICHIPPPTKAVQLNFNSLCYSLSFTLVPLQVLLKSLKLEMFLTSVPNSGLEPILAGTSSWYREQVLKNSNLKMFEQVPEPGLPTSGARTSDFEIL